MFYIVDTVGIFCLQWKSLSSKEQEKYVKEAEHQRFLHQQEHPDCSANENSVSPHWSHASRNEEVVKNNKNLLH